MTTILKISEAATIAIHSMVYLAKDAGRQITVKEISKRLEISENHLSKVLQRLVKVKLVASSKGPNGGFRLAKELSQINLLQVYEAIDGSFKNNNCLFRKTTCVCEECIMGDLIKSTNQKIKEYFEDKKLSDFVKGENLLS